MCKGLQEIFAGTPAIDASRQRREGGLIGAAGGSSWRQKAHFDGQTKTGARQEVHPSMSVGVRLDEKSSAACAVISWRDQVHIAWTGTDMRLNLASWPDGLELAGKQRLTQRSYKQVRRSSSGPNQSATMETVALPPSLAGSVEQLYMAWTGSNRALNVLVANPDPRSAPVTVKQRSTESPSVTTSERGDLILAWTGTDRHINLLTTDGDWSAAPVRLDAKRDIAPAVCTHRGGPVLAWTGTDRHINLLTTDGDWSAAPVRLQEAKSDYAPAVCSHHGSLILAWT